MENIYVDFEITKDDLNKFNMLLLSIMDWATGKILDGPSEFSLANSRNEDVNTIMNAASISYLFLTSKNLNFVFNHSKIKPRANEEKDNVNHPSHYTTGKYECIDVMIELYGVEFVKDFCLGNSFKYLYRAKRKNGIEDIKKAAWYLNKYLSLEEN